MSSAAAAAATNYVETALSGDQFSMQSSQLALQMSQSPEVRSYAQRTINDHAQLSSQLNAAAQSAGIASPQVVMLPQHSTLLSQLHSVRGADFDGMYKNYQVMTQMQALDVHQRYAATGEVPGLRTIASSAVPMVQSHLSQAQSLSIVPPPPVRTYRRSGERG
jgi:putative membrane protein